MNIEDIQLLYRYNRWANSTILKSVMPLSAEELSRLLRDWFPRVEIRGLSAGEEVYNVEYGRVQRNLRMARRKSKTLLPSYDEVRNRIISGAKSLLPSGAVERIRKAVRSRREEDISAPVATQLSPNPRSNRQMNNTPRQAAGASRKTAASAKPAPLTPHTRRRYRLFA